MTLSKFFVYLISLILGLVLISMILIGAVWLDVTVYRPWKNERNAATAHEWNDNYWENGHALWVTLTMEFSGPSGTTEVHETLLCTTKYLIRKGTFKNTADDYVKVYTTGPDSMSIPIGEGVVLRADIRNACKKAFVEFDQEFADHLKILGLYLRIVSENPVLTCDLGNGTGMVSENALRKAYISSVEAVPIRTLMEKRDFEVIEASDPSNRSKRPDGSLSYRNSVSWSLALGCWTQPRSEICYIPAKQICGTLIR
jgi:hypothetical protein